MRPPPFLKVLPADISRVGALGACILSLVRYVTSLPGETNDRKMVGDEVWWRAPHERISQALGGGVSRRTVSATVNKLVGTGELLSISRPDFYGDRAQLYRATDLPLAETDRGSGLPLAESADRLAESADDDGQFLPTWSAAIANLPSVGELEEHSVGKNARSRGTRLDPHWIPPQDVIEQMRRECPRVDLEAEHRKFVDYWTDQTGLKATKRSWVGTWRNWIRKAADNSRPHGHHTVDSTADQRVAQAQALKHGPPRLELL